MSEFTIDDPVLTIDEMEDALLVAIETKSRKGKPLTPKSVQELKVCYLNFCKKRDLDPSVPPQEQVAGSNKDQKWLDAHIQSITLAKKEKRLLARGRTILLRETISKLHDQGLEDLRDEYIKFCIDQQLPLTLQPEEQVAKTKFQAKRLHIYTLQLSLHKQRFDLDTLKTINSSEKVTQWKQLALL